MPDNAHLIFRLVELYELSRVLQHIKGVSARGINLMLKSQGSVWSDENFDHIIRHAEELAEKLEYVTQNAVKRGLVDNPNEYRWLLIKSITG
jgi:putative transposase